MDQAIARHCAELDRCNQRGGRMLSIFDLLKTDTLDLDLAAYLMARISRGASVMVGANPGGAGKTTVMCALLNLLPANTTLAAATDEAMVRVSQSPAPECMCLICHEIGPGPYFAYLWGDALRRYCALSDIGCLLATNLHADTFEEARAQVCVENGVPEAHFNAFNILVFLRLSGGWAATRRYVETVYESDGRSAHQLAYQHGHGLQAADTLQDDAHYRACRGFLKQHADGATRTIEQTRRLVVNFLAETND